LATVVAVGIDPVDALVLDSADARTETQAQHGEGGEVDLGIAVGVGVMLFDLELALVVKQTVQYKGSITVGAFNRQAVEGGVVIGHEGVKLQGEVAESGACRSAGGPGAAARSAARRLLRSCLRPTVKRCQGPRSRSPIAPRRSSGPPRSIAGRQRKLDGLALAAELFVELVLCLGVRACQQLVERVDHLIDGVAVALPEKADQRRTATWLGEFTQSSDRRLPHLVEQGPLVVGIEPREIDPQARP